MGNSYILKISSLSHTFSLIESGVDFSFKYNLIENDQLTNILKVLKVGDTFFCTIDDYIKSYFSIKNIDDKDVILNKIIEVAKGYKIEDINIVKKLEEDLIYKIDDNLKAEILKSMSPNTKEEKPYIPLDYTPCKDKIKSYNRIIFGAPGTGKSFELKHEAEFTKKNGSLYPDTTKKEDRIDLAFPENNVERVTFHPDYSYGQFVGSYKPVSDDDGRIRYEYVPGPFMRTLVKALEGGKNGESAEKFLLIVEEINRAKVAAVFGDMFQLLDRTDTGDSVYEIQASEDVRRYLARELGGTKDNYASIKLPNNMYIWATMNSADQGVFPMDTAFKRRWEFTYLGINENEDEVKKTIKTLPVLHNGNEGIEWNILRRSINTMLLKECKVNEDKLLGPFFISGDVFKNPSDKNAFFGAFNSKVLMYLFEDAGKMHQKKLFAGIDQSELTFSKVCEDFKACGTAIFGNSFQLVKE